MKNKLTIIAAVAAVAMAFTTAVQAAPITGTITMTGGAQVNSGSVSSATSVIGWNNTITTSASGSFTGIVNGTAVSFYSPWTFNSSGLPAAFWTVGGFSFNLTQSIASAPQALGGGLYSLSVFIAGTVTSSNPAYSPTAFIGSFSIQDPGTPGAQGATFSSSISFASVPDSGTTALLLGSALSGLALIRRKLNI
jgi:hypothetical protein